MSKVGKLSV